MREEVAPTVVGDCPPLCARHPAGMAGVRVAVVLPVVGRGPRRCTRCRGLMSCQRTRCLDPVPFDDRELGLFPGHNAKSANWLSPS